MIIGLGHDRCVDDRRVEVTRPTEVAQQSVLVLDFTSVAGLMQPNRGMWR
jgi:hypothetical protein